MEKLADAVVASDAVSCVESVFDQYSNFISLEPTLFSLAQREAYAYLNNPKAGDAEISDCIEQIVGGLFSLCGCGPKRTKPVGGKLGGKKEQVVTSTSRMSCMARRGI